MVLTILLLLLGINKQLDLQTLLKDVGRRMAKANGWYEHPEVLPGDLHRPRRPWGSCRWGPSPGWPASNGSGTSSPCWAR